ncbi:MAG: type II toxin-antitoxin system ParD family antitoxin [Planctomycetes bacterium]|nr:type II toxin-antitoxin system ParD family antitoxin [Planctomycetota bacterium]
MATMNISVPERMRKWVQKQIAGGGYSSASEYLRELIRADQSQRLSGPIEAKLLEGLDSGPATPMTKKDWDKLKSDLKRRHARRRRAGRPRA